MSLTLKDLRIPNLANPLKAEVRAIEKATRPASLADLVEVLKQEGAEEVTAKLNRDGDYWLLPVGDFDWSKPVKSGRYLVLPLGDTA